MDDVYNVLMEMKAMMGGKEPMQESEPEQGYNSPVDEGGEPGGKKKMFLAMMKKKMGSEE